MPKQLNDELVAAHKKTGLLPKDRLEVVVATPQLDNAMQLVAMSIGETRKMITELGKPKMQKSEEWTFDIYRDLDGNITRITAKNG